MKIIVKAKIRKEKAKKVRKEGKIPAVLYGPKIKNLNLEIDEKEFNKILKEVGESSFIKLKIENKKPKGEEFLVLIHDIQYNPLTEKPIHVDFYLPLLKEEIEVKVPIIFEGEAPAVKELGGTFVKIIDEIEVRATPQNLPKEIKVNIDKLKTFEDAILVSDLNLPKGVKVKREEKEVLARVLPPEKIEREMKEEIEEKVEREASVTGEVEEKKEEK